MCVCVYVCVIEREIDLLKANEAKGADMKMMKILRKRDIMARIILIKNYLRYRKRKRKWTKCL